jgi:hypothetical protein
MFVLSKYFSEMSKEKERKGCKDTMRKGAKKGGERMKREKKKEERRQRGKKKRD